MIHCEKEYEISFKEWYKKMNNKPIKCPYINNSETNNVCGNVICPQPYWNCIIFQKINNRSSDNETKSNS